MEEPTITEEEYRKILNERISKSKSSEHETLEVAKSEEKPLTIDDLVSVEDTVEENDDELICGSCGSKVTKDMIRCANCNEELVW